MTKSELEKYARDNRKRLEAQEVKLGDVVKVLIGQFAGEKGVVVGIIACGNDYADPYYEIDMDCEVPDKYKCRKTLITPNNVIGGLSAYEFVVYGNRAPEQPTDEIKVGDRVKFKSEEEIKKMLEPSFWWGISIFADKEATIIGIDEPYGYRIDIDPSLGGIRREFFDKIPKKQPKNTITIPVKADFGEDVGFALLDRALELQKKHTELEGEVKRLYEFVFNLSHGATMLQPIQFDNECLGYVANAVRFDFRPHTKEETETQLTALRAVLGKEG